MTGSRSRAFWEQENDRRREIGEAVLADLGRTPEDASQALLLTVDSIAKFKLVADSAFHHMAEAGGPLSSSGRARRALTVWLAATAALEKHLRLVGLERRPKPAASLADFIEQRAAGQGPDQP